MSLLDLLNGIVSGVEKLVAPKKATLATTRPVQNPISSSFAIGTPNRTASPISTSIIPKSSPSNNPVASAQGLKVGNAVNKTIRGFADSPQTFGAQLAAQNDYANSLKQMTSNGQITNKDYVAQTPNSIVKKSGIPVVGTPVKVLSQQADAKVKAQVAKDTGVNYNYGTLLGSGLNTAANVIPGAGEAKVADNVAKSGEEVAPVITDAVKQAATKMLADRSSQVAEGSKIATPTTQLLKEPAELKTTLPKTAPAESVAPAKSAEPVIAKTGSTGKVAPQTVTQPTTKLVSEINPSDKVVSPIEQDVKQRGLTTSVKESQNFTPEFKEAVQSNYKIATDKEALANTQQFMKQGLNKAHQTVLDRLGSTNETDKQLVSDAGTVMQTLDSKGRYAEAQNIHDQLAERLTKAGQSAQATSLLLRRSPDGLYHQAVSDLQKAKVELTPDINKQLETFRESVRSTAPNTVERNFAVQQMKQFVSQNIPSSVKDKAFAVWRAGLLTGPRTIGKIVTSHAIQSTLERVKDIPAAAVDSIVAAANGGRRSLVFTNRGTVSGAKEGLATGFGKNGLLRTGIDTNPGNNAVEFHNEVNFGKSVAGKIANTYTNGIGRLHGSIYKVPYGIQFKNSLFSQALAAAKTGKIPKEELNGFIDRFINEPSNEALDIAKNDAEHATFQQETALGKIASKVQQIPGGRYVAPFTRIPSAIATDVADYSPVGVVKTIVQGVKAAKKGEGWSLADQRNFSEGLGRSIVGTAALVPGYLLFQKGLVNLAYPTDKTEQGIWKAEGRTEDSVLVGGKWRSLGSLGPVGTVLEVGAGLASGKAGANKGVSGIPGAALSAGEVGLKSIEDQPYVSGISAAGAAAQNPTEYLPALEKQYAGSVVPTAVSQIADGTDPLARQANTPLDSIKNKVPGLRETLNPSKDAFGKNVPNDTGVGAIVDPFYSSTNQKPDSTLSEIQRLQKVGQGILPTAQDAKNTFNGVPTTLTKVQAQDLSAKIGQTVKPLWDNAVQDPDYQSLSDDQKNQKLSSILSNTTSAIKDTYAQQNKLGQYADGFNGKVTKLSAAQQQIQNGSKDISSYFAPAKTTSASTSTKTSGNKATTTKKSTATGKASIASYIAAQKATNASQLSNEKALNALLKGIKYTRKKVKVT